MREKTTAAEPDEAQPKTQRSAGTATRLAPELSERCTRVSAAKGTLRVGVLTNPSSGGNRSGLEAFRTVLAEHPEACHCEAKTPAEVGRALARFGDQGVDVLAINGGDGTVHAVLTELFRSNRFDTLPLLAALRGGTASMTARDVGLKGSGAKGLSRVLAWARSTNRDESTVTRPVLCVRGAAPDQEPLYGMFFGAGAIHQGIEFFHRSIRGLGLRGEISSGLTLIRLLLAVARRDRRYVRPVPVSVGLDDGVAEEREYLAVIISTLERLIVGLRPYFGVESGPLHFTAVGAHPKHFLRTLPTLARGRPCRCGTPQNGYYSHNVHRVQLSIDSGFTLDGELYGPNSRHGPVLVEEAGPVSFLRL